jgi:hypothetical protein
MQKIYLESANSYKGAVGGAGWADVVAAYDKELGFNKMYSVIQRAKVKNKPMVHLPNYAYRLRTESAENGCLTNGSTAVNTLLNCLRGVQEVGPDVVYIISANSAHHWSYPLSKAAFARANNQKKKVVVNIDNHRDYGSFQGGNKATGTTPIECGGWGGFHVGYWSQQSEGGAVYVTLANGKDGAGKKQYHVVYSADHEAADHTVTFLGNDEVLDYLKTFTSEQHDVYFTMDRDFMAGNGTKYGDQGCLYTTGDGMKFVKQCIQALKGINASFVGADMIGLPTNNMDAGVSGNKKQFDDAVDNVKHFLKYIG